MGFVAATNLLMTPCAVSAAPSLENSGVEKTPPRVDGKPVEVSIGFYILDLARVPSRDESFDATGYLEMNWRDPRTARSNGSSKGARRHHPGPIWTPRVFFENALEQP